LCHIHTWHNLQEKQKFKNWGILEAGACDHQPGLPATEQNTNSCTAESRTRLLATGLNTAWVILSPSPARSCRLCLPRCGVGQLTIPFYEQREQPPAFSPGLFIFSFSNRSSCLLESKMSPVLKIQLCKAPLRLHPSVLCEAKSQLALIKHRIQQPLADASLEI